MKKPRFGPMILAVLLVGSLVFMPSGVTSLTINQNEVHQASSTLDPNIFQGTLMQQRMLESKQYLPIYGSSELHRLDMYHPTNYFKINPDGFTPFLIGRAGMYSLVHFLNLAANPQLLRNRKIVFIISPEWFSQKGLSEAYFAGTFSKQQVYQLIFSSRISPELKQKAARRLLQFAFIRHDWTVSTLLNRVAYPNRSSGIAAAAASMQGYFSYKVLTLHDAIKMQQVTPNYYKSQYQSPNKMLQGKSWSELKKMAAQYMMHNSNSNRFHLDNAFYLKQIKGRLLHFKNYDARQHFGRSPEYGDLQLVLDLLKQQHAKALFISIPFNGSWYNYAGVSVQKRQTVYQQIAGEIHRSGFQLADFTRFDNKPYFLEDTMHIGPEGWVYVDQAIKNFYDRKS